MKEPVWIDDLLVAALHRRQIAEHGGAEGIRDTGLLESALGRPKQLFHYGDPPPDIASLAASYAYGVAKNHPFFDGNKRTSLIVCRLFLSLNGYELVASQAEKYQTFLSLAAGELTEEQLAAWIRANISLA